MTTEDVKIIIQEFDRLNLTIPEGLNLLMDAGKISDHVVMFGDVAHEDGPACIEFLKQYKPQHPPFHTPATMNQFR